MGESLKARLRALERDRAAGRPTGGVVTFKRNETPEEALKRARRGGVTGPVLLVPETMEQDEWEKMIRKETGNTPSTTSDSRREAVA